MRVTKTRQMRNKTINPNPPICRSKELSFTYVEIYSCQTGQLVGTVAEYGLSFPSAQAAASVEPNFFSSGYYYQPDFHVFTPLGENKCTVETWYCAWTPIGQLPLLITLRAPIVDQMESFGGPWWTLMNDPSGDRYPKGSTHLGITGDWTEPDNPANMEMVIDVDTITWPASSILEFLIVTEREYELGPGYFSQLFGYAYIPVPTRVKMCVEGSAEELTAAGWEIVSGPYTSQSNCEGPCSIS